MSVPESILQILTPLFDASLSQATAARDDAQLALCVAYSGGLDSTVLLKLAADYASRRSGVAVRALHVNHRISADSDQWQQHCEVVCQELEVAYEAFGVDVSRTGELGLEAAAREARYAVFEQSLRPGELLLLAQHQDDQLETVMLQLMRGSGVKGLAAMPALASFGAGHLCRPLLMADRETIEVAGRESGLSWIDDPSNFDTSLDRNFLRHSVLPALKERWPSAAKTTARSARMCAESDALNQVLALQDAEGVHKDNALQIAGLSRLEPARQRNLIRWLLAECDLPMPPETRLAEITGSLMQAADDASPEVRWPGAVVQRFRDALFVFADTRLAPPVVPEGCLQPGGSMDLGVAGTIELRPAEQGLRLKADTEVQVRFRSGGERIRPAGGANSRSLKNLFQEQGVPPWMRDRIPMLYCRNELIAVGDLWLADEWCETAAGAGSGEFYAVFWTGHLPVTYPA